MDKSVEAALKVWRQSPSRSIRGANARANALMRETLAAAYESEAWMVDERYGNMHPTVVLLRARAAELKGGK